MEKTYRDILLERIAIELADFSSDELDEMTEYVLALKAGTLDNKGQDKIPHLADLNN